MKLVKQKGLAPVVIVVLIAALAVGGYLIYKLPRTAVPPPTPQTTPMSSPTPNPSPAPADAGETTNWKTYTDSQIGYSIKYPQEIILPRSNCDTFVLPASEGERIRVQNQKRSGMELAFKIEGLEFAVCEMANEQRLTPEQFAKIHSPESQFTPMSLDNQSGVTAYTEIFINSPQNKILRIWYRYSRREDKLIVDQILSTFKFLP